MVNGGGGDDDGGGAGIANNSHGTQLSNSENTLFCQYQACRNYTMWDVIG